ncbi:MAG: DUF4339 domain-containing protein [Chlamydiia bacterium]
MDDPLLLILASMISAGLCMWRARAAGRHIWGWGMAGFLLGIPVLVVLLLLPRPRAQRLAPATQSATPSASARPAPTPPQPFCNDPMQEGWYYVSKERQAVGPLPLAQLIQAFHEGQWQIDSLLWHPEVTEWQPPSQFPTLVAAGLPLSQGE